MPSVFTRGAGCERENGRHRRIAYMKAVVADPVGGPENLKCIDLPKGEPGDGEVLVKIHASGVNFIDVYHRTGLYKLPEMPVRLGTEGAGTVEVSGTGT